MKKSDIYEIGTVYEYNNPRENRNDSNIEIKYSNNDIHILYYILNNFLYSKNNNDKLNQYNSSNKNTSNKKNISRTYDLEVFPFEETLKELEELKLKSNNEMLSTINNNQNKKYYGLTFKKNKLLSKIKDLELKILSLSKKNIFTENN
jgi:hypothetical protein